MPPKLASDAPTPLREELERIGMSHSALARALGVDRRQARLWITGEHTPEPPRREQIVQAVAAAGGAVTVGQLWPDANRRAA